MSRISAPRKVSTGLLQGLLDNVAIRRVDHEGHTFYVASDVLWALTVPATMDELGGAEPAGLHADEDWYALAAREPRLASFVQRLELADGSGDAYDMLALDGILRLVQAVRSPAAEKLKVWLARAGERQWEESSNPELAWIRLQGLYDQRGYSSPWVQKRLRGMAARQELVSEWSRRGVRESEQYRDLTNDLMQAAFGMDVNAYRGHKQLRRTSENLRDHMTDLELTLTMLGETTAVALHRAHDSRELAHLKQDVVDAGQVVRLAREEIERRSGRAVISPTPTQPFAEPTRPATAA